MPCRSSGRRTTNFQKLGKAMQVEAAKLNEMALERRGGGSRRK